MSTPQVQRPAPMPQHNAGPTIIGASAEQVLAKAQGSRAVIQDFVPLADSLEWQLGQEFLRDRGTKVFTNGSGPGAGVPYVINNDGTMSHQAAAVFFTSLVEAEQAGALAKDEEICALELGIGVGLFACIFLDAFRQLCARAGKDYYHRFTYVAGDRSEKMLGDLLRNGTLNQHSGRYRVRQVDAMQPGELLPRDVAFGQHGGRPFRAVFLNYLLDCLPAAVLEFNDQEVRQLHVRTCVARNVQLEDYTDLTAGQLAQRAKSRDPQAQQELLETYHLFASEYRYDPVQPATLPHGEWAVQLGRGSTKRLLHSYGAIQCLERLLPLVHERGFLLMNDYGSDRIEIEKDSDFEHQRFSLATFVGVNFAQLGKYFEAKRQPACRWDRPGGQNGIFSRLLAHQHLKETTVCFLTRFSQGEHDRLQKPLLKARQWLHVGRFELAAAEYQEAVRLQPYNWVLLNEIAMFLIFQQREVKAGMDVAKLALAQNPGCSSELWNTLGDGLYEWGRLEEARSAYQKAITVNESDVRARYNLAWVHVRQKDAPAALQVIAEGLALDKMGQYRERLLHKQQEALALLQVRQQQEYLLLINLVSRHAQTPALDRDTASVPRATGDGA